MISGLEPPSSWSTDPTASVIFGRTKEEFGGLSNMAAGFPLVVNGTLVRTSEALYQALRFPFAEEVQRKIIAQTSPMGAKIVSREHSAATRPDWTELRVEVMRWCLEVKLHQNQQNFGNLLKRTGDLAIIEYSKRDDFWGAVRLPQGGLAGRNVLGRLLMELRDRAAVKRAATDEALQPPQIVDFLLFGEPIAPVKAALPAHAEAEQDQLFQIE